MALNFTIPLSGVEPGGRILSVLNALNNADKLKQEAKYYAPNVESLIANRNALTKGQNIENQYLPDKLRLANAFAQLQNKYYKPNIQSEIANRNALTNKYNIMTPLEAEELKLKNKFYPEATRADINYKNMGGGRGGVDLKNLNAYYNQLQADNPRLQNEDENSYNNRINQIAEAYNNDETILPNGEPVPKISNRARQLQNAISNRNVPAAVKKQLSSYDILVEDLQDFDINTVKQFAGPQGRIKLAKAKAQMATNPDDPSIDPVARRYLSSLNNSIRIMDTLRLAFGTSIVPEYVYETIGKLANPNNSIWSDSKQVQQNYDDVLKEIRKTRNTLRSQYKKGLGSAPYSSEEKTENNQKAQKHPSQMTDEEIRAELASYV